MMRSALSATLLACLSAVAVPGATLLADDLGLAEPGTPSPVTGYSRR